jgi:hypothetical protein
MIQNYGAMKRVQKCKVWNRPNSHCRVTSGDKFRSYKFGAKVEEFFSVVFVPGPILIPVHDVQVKKKSQVDPIRKPVKLDPIRSAKGEI